MSLYTPRKIVKGIKDYFSSKPEELNDFCNHEKSYMLKNSDYGGPAVPDNISERFEKLAGIK